MNLPYPRNTAIPFDKELFKQYGHGYEEKFSGGVHTRSYLSRSYQHSGEVTIGYQERLPGIWFGTRGEPYGTAVLF